MCQSVVADSCMVERENFEIAQVAEGGELTIGDVTFVKINSLQLVEPEHGVEIGLADLSSREPDPDRTVVRRVQESTALDQVVQSPLVLPAWPAPESCQQETGGRGHPQQATLKSCRDSG